MTYLNDNETRVSTLLEMLSIGRPDGSKSERQWIARWLRPLDVESDAAGNLYKLVPAAGDATPLILWSAHTDTVHRRGGAQQLVWRGKDKRILGTSNGDCLGADNGAGVWLLREMIQAGVPGLYVFHRGEEHGGTGSAWIARHKPDLLAPFKAAIAFDRRGTDSIITHQLPGRTCSDAFADSLCDAIGMNYAKDDGGTFTDTANYVDDIGECSNVSVGYAHEHTAIETLDVGHLLALRMAMLAMDQESLIFSRQPGEVEKEDFSSFYRGYSRHYESAMLPGWSQLGNEEESTSEVTLRQLCADSPDEVADFLEEYGVSPEELSEAIYHRGGIVRRYRS